MTAAPSLTARQQEVLELMAQGLTRSQIAEWLVVGVETVASHQHAVYARLGVHTAHGAVAAGYRAGLLNEPAMNGAAR